MAKLSIKYPVFRHAPAVTLGRGAVRSLAELDDGRTAFFLSGAEPVWQYVNDALRRGSGALTEANSITKPAGEPTTAAVRNGAAFLSGRETRRIVAIGGGSVLDWARLAWAEAAGFIDLGSARMSADRPLDARPEIWLVPTTCGTGAEAADVVVYANDEGIKCSVVSPALMANQVVLDGRFLDNMAAARLSSFVSDALSHGVESYLSVVPNSLAKESALSALELIFTNFSSAPSHCQQDRLMEAGFLAGVAAANCSVGIVHAFAHSIGADGVPHGLANACALEAGLEFNGQTSQMGDLLRRLHLTSIDRLTDKIRRITSLALEGISNHPAIVRLANSGYRQEIAEHMSRDITIRSNPRRPTADDRLGFVTDISARLSRI